MDQNRNEMLHFLKINWPLELRKQTFRYYVVRLDRELIDYMMADSVFVSERLLSASNLGVEEEDQCPRFPIFEKIMKQILEEFDSQLFIKFNWWSPKDCCDWANKLRFQNLHDVLMALKTSSRIMEMICDYEEWCQGADNNLIVHEKNYIGESLQKGYFLEIRKWYNLNSLNEYRCFIFGQKLKGISQKNLYQIYLNGNQHKQRLIEFIQNEVIPVFDQQDYVVDLYIDVPPKQRIIVVDIGPWQEFSSPKLFTYQELTTLNDEPLFRTVQTAEQIQHEDLSSYRLPSEFTDLDNPDQLVDLIEQIYQSQKQE